MKTLALVLVAATAFAVPAVAQQAVTTTTKTYVEAKPTDVLAKSLIGLDIENAKEENIGEIQDVLLSRGNVAGYVVSVGGFVGIGEHYVVVSPNALRINYSENDKKWTVRMDATKDDVKAAPPFKYEGRWKK